MEIGHKVYPRACGGTFFGSPASLQLIGLSPRVRGNPKSLQRLPAGPGSIPARAGEPGGAVVSRAASPVYPRACGGTRAGTMRFPVRRGLSPRVRGNPQWQPPARPARRSIPARAGEPSGRWKTGFQPTVYPRACGGTVMVLLQAGLLFGLSPRVRGNPAHRPDTERPRRSIPARAGEPMTGVWPAWTTWVYPRACGGTGGQAHVVSEAEGLSPRVRGNPFRASVLATIDRSIPARAGEPNCSGSNPGNHRVYPRACGGTTCADTSAASVWGLSPRVRGNHLRRHLRRQRLGSIPARAGEPSP